MMKSTKTGRAAVAAMLLLGMSAGCQQLGAAIAVMSGGETLDPEFKLAKGPLLIMADDPESLGVPPEALRRLHEELKRIFGERKVNDRVVPFDDLERIRQREEKFDDFSIRKVGEMTGADQVLYVRFNYWAMKENPTDPHFHGRATVGVKVISTERKREVKLWPSQGDYKTIEIDNKPSVSEASNAEVTVAREVMDKLAERIGENFHEHKARERLDR